MSETLFIIGNGFDLEHKLPTSYDPDFKEISREFEQLDNFWDLYQSLEENIWSDFENLLAYPDFEQFDCIFEQYFPDYASEYEHDRHSIIHQVELNALLRETLIKFVENAEKNFKSLKQITMYKSIFSSNSKFITFNYTSVLQTLYEIKDENILYIHGRLGEEMIFGYLSDDFKPEKMQIDLRGKGRGPYSEKEVNEYFATIDDYYVRTAYENFYDKIKSFVKNPRPELIEKFLKNCPITEIKVIGHSCSMIDYIYFKMVANIYPDAIWRFRPFDDNTRSRQIELVSNLRINAVFDEI